MTTHEDSFCLLLCGSPLPLTLHPCMSAWNIAENYLKWWGIQVVVNPGVEPLKYLE